MAAISGSIEEVTIGGRVFPVAADAEVQRKLGGFENEMLSNGDGSTRQSKTRVPWTIDGLTLEVDDARGDHEFLQALADDPDYFPITVTFASGITYQGNGQITGEMQTSSQSTTAAVNFSGPGKMSVQR